MCRHCLPLLRKIVKYVKDAGGCFTDGKYTLHYAFASALCKKTVCIFLLSRHKHKAVFLFYQINRLFI